MNPRLVLLVLVAATAYVFGARAGRGRFEEIKHLALGVWNDPATKKTRKKIKKASKKEARQFGAIAKKARSRLSH
ncbi:hypothetical protein HQQ80_16685 [Microbacteriaceae bacterium VKM Ac-2855]|nr:hypothetical protein [Microbacteriaceae bacterium VKM Ac-2855]